MCFARFACQREADHPQTQSPLQTLGSCPERYSNNETGMIERSSRRCDDSFRDCPVCQGYWLQWQTAWLAALLGCQRELQTSIRALRMSLPNRAEARRCMTAEGVVMVGTPRRRTGPKLSCCLMCPPHPPRRPSTAWFMALIALNCESILETKQSK